MFVNRFLTLIVNAIFGSTHSRVLIKMVILYILEEFRWWGPFPVELQVYRLCGSGLLRGCFSIILFTNWVNYCFLGNCTYCLLDNFKYTFYFNLHGRKALWRALLAGGFLINIWYCMSFLLNINYALVIYRDFLHLLTQCFY